MEVTNQNEIPTTNPSIKGEAPIVPKKQLQKFPDILKTWIYRLLERYSHFSYDNFKNDLNISPKLLFIMMGIDTTLLDEQNDFKKIMQQQRELHMSKPTAEELPPVLQENIKLFCQYVPLNPLEQKFLALLVIISYEVYFDEVIRQLCSKGFTNMRKLISIALNCKTSDLDKALDEASPLMSASILTDEFVRLYYDNVGCRQTFISKNFPTYMYKAKCNVKMLNYNIEESKPAELCNDDYRQLPQLDYLIQYLKTAIATRRIGVNVLLYGAPGTGKTQLAKLLAKNINVTLMEVRTERKGTGSINGVERMRSYGMAQNFFKNSNSIILFDECEDVIVNRSNPFANKEKEEISKGYINKLLENNYTPTIWACNSIAFMDPSMLRRFDTAINMPHPTRQQRLEMIQSRFTGIIPTADINLIADQSKLTPALINKTSEVLKLMISSQPPEEANKIGNWLFNNALRPLGSKKISLREANGADELYDPNYINSDVPLSKIVHGLQSTKCGRICLNGAPGTGKTAFARYVAREIGIPLLMKKASDLLSKWVGGTEQNIANAFEEAEQEGALLLIDEADSFLQDREQAQRSWEVTQVNEFLTQMESYTGMFIATTNLMEGLDRAAIRRFDAKIQFGFMRREQKVRLFQALMQQLDLKWSIPAQKEELLGEFMQLDNLTPGDFHVILRQHRFNPIDDAEMLVSRIAQESVVKRQGRARAIGFTY